MPGPRAWSGVTWGALTALVAMLLAMAYGLFGQTAPGWFWVGLPLSVVSFLLAGGLLTLVWGLIVRLPAVYVWVWASALLVFSLADAGESPALAPIDLTIEVVDNTGETARLPLSTFSPLQPRLEGRLGKTAFMSPFPFSEPVLQHFEFPLAAFVAVNPAFNPAQLTEMSLRFDRTPSGLVALDDLGLRP